MISRKEVEALFSNPDLLFTSQTEIEKQELHWFNQLTTKLFHNKGYWVSDETWRELDFPDADAFALTAKLDGELANLYKNFAWRGFLTYCQPVLEGNRLKGFAYKGNIELNQDVIAYMMRFPSIDWLNSVLLNSNIEIPDDLYDLISSNKTSWSMDICAEFKQVQSRLYALLYLLDVMPFVVRSFDANFDTTIECYTRNPVLINKLISDKKLSEQLIHELDFDKDFDTPLSNIIKCVRLIVKKATSTSLDYTGEIVSLDTRTPFMQMISYPELKAFTDGFSECINDMPNRAALLTLDLQKAGTTQRYGTLDKKILRDIYSDTKLLKTNPRNSDIIGLDIADFNFKYWNLQKSIYANQSWSCFSPFSIRGLANFDFEQLSNGISNTDNDLICTKFREALQDDIILHTIAVICDIDSTSPDLYDIMLDYMTSKQPAELYEIMLKDKELFNIA